MANSYFDLFLGYSAIWLILFLLFARLAVLQIKILKNIRKLEQND